MEINVNEFAGTKTLRHRDTAQLVLNKLAKIPKNEDITIDFSGISFASRSFWHELKKGLKNKNVNFVNMLPEVEYMMLLTSIKPLFNLKEPINVKKLKLITA